MTTEPMAMYVAVGVALVGGITTGLGVGAIVAVGGAVGTIVLVGADVGVIAGAADPMALLTPRLVSAEEP